MNNTQISFQDIQPIEIGSLWRVINSFSSYKSDSEIFGGNIPISNKDVWFTVERETFLIYFGTISVPYLYHQLMDANGQFVFVFADRDCEDILVSVAQKFDL